MHPNLNSMYHDVVSAEYWETTWDTIASLRFHRPGNKTIGTPKYSFDQEDIVGSD